MSYTKQSWVDNTTPVDAEHLNHMEDGIAANADDVSQLSNDLTDKFGTIDSGSLFDVKKSGVYFVRSAVTDKPVSVPGMYILSYYNASYIVGLYIPCYDLSVSENNRPFVNVNNNWMYSLDRTAVSTTSIPLSIGNEPVEDI